MKSYNVLLNYKKKRLFGADIEKTISITTQAESYENAKSIAILDAEKSMKGFALSYCEVQEVEDDEVIKPIPEPQFTVKPIIPKPQFTIQEKTPTIEEIFPSVEPMELMNYLALQAKRIPVEPIELKFYETLNGRGFKVSDLSKGLQTKIINLKKQKSVYNDLSIKGGSVKLNKLKHQIKKMDLWISKKISIFNQEVYQEQKLNFLKTVRPKKNNLQKTITTKVDAKKNKITQVKNDAIKKNQTNPTKVVSIRLSIGTYETILLECEAKGITITEWFDRQIATAKNVKSVVEEMEQVETTKQVKEFMQAYYSWYKKISNDMTVFLSIPNRFNSALIKLNENPVYIEMFEKKNQNIDAKKYMKELLQMADANNISLYLQPIPRQKYLDEGKKNKITIQYLEKYFENFGFKKIVEGFMERISSIDRPLTIQELFFNQATDVKRKRGRPIKGNTQTMTNPEFLTMVERFHKPDVNNYLSSKKCPVCGKTIERHLNAIGCCPEHSKLIKSKREKERYQERNELIKQSKIISSSEKHSIISQTNREYIDSLKSWGAPDLKIEKLKERHKTLLELYSPISDSKHHNNIRLLLDATANELNKLNENNL